MKNEIEQIAQQNDMSIEFVTWFFNEKKVRCGNVWFMMMAAMWEGWKGRSIEMDKLAAENVALKESRNNLAEFIHEELDADYPLNMNLETHATDRIVAGIKADGVEEFAAHLRANDNGASVCKMIALGADDFAKQLREGDGK
ncbi:hypothetical protein OLO36_07025 [Klebsiella pneumoniae]|uniref:hypothetical protein n=1 Tax=Klebsiella pneumoniae TaxID=573 RepID=UPI001F03A57B|nr:hypothetical protein [Klebsiella pneumoniae]EKW0549984.1 hypothetical protein [Klebsiella pneumoniae]MCW1423421.1 hypothetical protein [Klebsiella pneumoniae]HBR3478433.1 hypothetical protein [Klebsiella pneumoniae]